MKFSALVLAAGATAVLASQSEPQVSTNHLEARDPTFGLIHDILGGFLGGGHSSVRYPSKNWKCNGRGNDGYQYDCYGNSRPRNIPYGWAYFGTEIGWAPTASWSCSHNFKFDLEFLKKAHLVTWWTPSSAWKRHNVGINLGISVPGFWGLLPSANWKCSGSGKDGWSLDHRGHGRPSWAPSGWLWFGESIGWAPPSGYNVSVGFQLPSAFLPHAHKCTWWVPSTAWLNHNHGLDFGVGVKVPSLWGWVPSKNWKCNRSGKDGWQVDHHGNGRPSWAPSGWLWFGEQIGWGPPVGFDISTGFQLPSAFLPHAHKCTWWVPSTAWINHNHGIDFGVGVTIPSFWGLKPSANWKCNGSGKDGWSVDHKGNGRPSWVPAEGWFWFGIEFGWQPSASWNCGSSWTIPSQWQSTCGKASWWTPPKPWVNKHHGHNWHFGFRPPTHWGCEVPPSTTSLPPVQVTTTSKPHSTTTTKPHVATTTSVKHTTTTKAKPHTSTSTHKATTTSKPSPKPTGGNGNETVTVTKTVTKIVTVPTSSSGASCKCDEEQHRLARRSKSRQDSL
ncbi:hypothetical protein JCM16303_003186 [Sporobolomyces ruberrimus]